MTVRNQDDEEQLQRLLQAALPPVASTPPTDVWPRIADHLDAHPAWTPFDLALAAGIVLALLLVPEAIFVIALHF